MNKLIVVFCGVLFALLNQLPTCIADTIENQHMRVVKQLIDAHPGQSGAYVLEKGEESLLARAWLADHAVSSIEVQYFIWSTDNIGILAAEALLRAADRGVDVRVIVDDLLVDASTESLMALALHPNIEIKIYNPRHSVGVSIPERLLILVTDFRSSNQRMHDKTFIVDGHIGITGGRNMADEYFDYDQEYNFRDRDILVMGPVVHEMQVNFNEFWESPLSALVEDQLASDIKYYTPAHIAPVYDQLHEYANDEQNFAPEVRQALHDLPNQFSDLIDTLTWDTMQFISDQPGKNPGNSGLGGGGIATQRLIDIVKGAQEDIIIQSPYLVLPEGGMELFKSLIDRGVKIAIVTNSLASTDNLPAYSGYHKQRKKLLEIGVSLFEYKPKPAIMKDLIDRYKELNKTTPIFAIHAKTLIVDRRKLFIGTFNLDPRSANLNTEVGVMIDNTSLARSVTENILADMQPENSWNPDISNPDKNSSALKRLKLFFLNRLPLDPVL